jgi:hypothetical protein
MQVIRKPRCPALNRSLKANATATHSTLMTANYESGIVRPYAPCCLRENQKKGMVDIESA